MNKNNKKPKASNYPQTFTVGFLRKVKPGRELLPSIFVDSKGNPIKVYAN